MSAYASEKYKIIPLSLNTSTTTAVKGQAVSLRNVGKVSVVCGYLVDQFVLDSVAEVESSIAHAATFTVYVGDATQNPSSFAALTGATVVLGMTTAGQLTNWQEIQVQVIGTCATGISLTIGHGNTTKTFTIEKNASLADAQIGSSNSTVFGNCLASAINMYFPGLELVAGTTVGSGDTKAWTGIIKEKYQGIGGINAAVTVQSVSTVDIINVNGFRQVGMIEFDAADVIATNSCYSQFTIESDCNTTINVKQTAYAILEIKDGSAYSHKKVGI